MKKRLAMVLLACSMIFCLVACGGKNGENTGDGAKQTQAQMSWQEQYDLGIRLLNEGKYEDAILAFQAAIQIDPKKVDTYLALADLHMQMGNAGKAQSALQQGVNSCGETSYEIFISVATKYEIVLTIDGQEMVGETLTWDEYMDKGDQLIADGKFEDAIRAYEDAIAQEDDEPEPYLGMAEAYVQMGDIEKAIEALQKGYDACWSSSDQQKILDYAKELGYVLDNNGKLVKFDEEAFLAAATPLEKLEYYMSFGNNKNHWCFDGALEVDGRDSRTITLDDVVELSSRLGWGAMTYDEPDGSKEQVQTSHSGATVALAGAYRSVDETEKTHFEYLHVGGQIDLDQWHSHYDQNLKDGFDAAVPVGIYDIHLGDSPASVLAALGWDHAEEIAALLLQSLEEPIGEYNSWYRRTDAYQVTDGDAGDKSYEQFEIDGARSAFPDDPEEPSYIRLTCMVGYETENSRGSNVEFVFQSSLEYRLVSVTVWQWY